jgi:hypothetical protein
MNYWKYKYRLLSTLIMISSISWGQTVQIDTLQIFKLRDRNAFMTTDHLGALYIIERNEISKYPKPVSSKKRVRFSDPQNGEIAHIDPFNPLAVVLLYKPFNLIQIIDNQLNRATANFSPEQINIMDIQLVSSTEQNMIWLYDQATDRLHRFNTETRKTEYQSQIITKLAGMEVSPNYLVSDMNGVYLNSPEVGVMIFDFFGNYIKTISVKNLKRFQVKSKNLIFWKDHKLEMQSINTPQRSSVLLKGIDPVSIRLEDNYLFIQTEQHIVITNNPFI